MKKADAPARWYHAWQTQRAEVDDDAADMGTAFGLDMSIADDDAKPASRSTAKGSGASFMARWTNRRKTAN